MDLAFGYISQDYDDPRPWYDMPGACVEDDETREDNEEYDPDWF
jgi:hypothetical protein